MIRISPNGEEVTEEQILVSEEKINPIEQDCESPSPYDGQ